MQDNTYRSFAKWLVGDPQIWAKKSPCWGQVMADEPARKAFCSGWDHNSTLCCQGKGTQSRRPGQRWGLLPPPDWPGSPPFQRKKDKKIDIFQRRGSPVREVRQAWLWMCSVQPPKNIWGELFAVIPIFHVWHFWPVNWTLFDLKKKSCTNFEKSIKQCTMAQNPYQQWAMYSVTLRKFVRQKLS